mgnify:CR=1 FL=1
MDSTQPSPTPLMQTSTTINSAPLGGTSGSDNSLGTPPAIDAPITIDETQGGQNNQDSGISVGQIPDPSSQTPTPTSPNQIDDGLRNYENTMSDSSSQFFSDFGKSSYPDTRNNMNQIQRDMSGLSKLSSDLLNNDILMNCINNLLQTDGDDDSIYINFFKTNSIDKYTSDHFSYLSKKVSKFLSLGPEDYLNCLQKLPSQSNIKSTICNGGIISLSIYYIAQIFEFFGNAIDTKSIQPNTKEFKNFKQLYDIFLNNANSVVKKTIDVSKYFEQKYCNNNLSTNTMVADMFYNKLFTSKANVEYKLFDNVNIKIGFLDELRKSFFGQVMILLVLFVISWKIISLFK